MSTLNNLVDNFGSPQVLERDMPMKVQIGDVNDQWVDKFRLHDPTSMSDALSMGKLTEHITFTQSDIPREWRTRDRRRRRKKPTGIPLQWKSFSGKNHADDACDQERGDPKLCPTYVQLRETPTEVKYEGGLVDEKDCTTVVVKNIPRHYTMDHLFQELSELGLGKGVDYMNLLEDKRGGKNRGYAFVNFLSHELALQCMHAIEGHMWHRTENTSTTVQQGSASWALIQGFAANNNAHPMVAVIPEESGRR